MLVFGVHEGERVAVDVPIGATVGEVKKLIQVWYSFLIALVLLVFYALRPSQQCFSHVGTIPCPPRLNQH